MKQTNQPNNQELLKLFRALSDRTRLDILQSIVKKPLTVGEIHASLGQNVLTLSAVSHQLTHMENLGIISAQKKGRKKYYGTSPNFCWCILKNGLEHFSHGKAACPACSKARPGKDDRTM